MTPHYFMRWVHIQKHEKRTAWSEQLSKAALARLSEFRSFSSASITRRRVPMISPDDWQCWFPCGPVVNITNTTSYYDLLQRVHVNSTSWALKSLLKTYMLKRSIQSWSPSKNVMCTSILNDRWKIMHIWHSSFSEVFDPDSFGHTLGGQNMHAFWPKLIHMTSTFFLSSGSAFFEKFYKCSVDINFDWSAHIFFVVPQVHIVSPIVVRPNSHRNNPYLVRKMQIDPQLWEDWKCDVAPEKYHHPHLRMNLTQPIPKLCGSPGWRTKWLRPHLCTYMANLTHRKYQNDIRK